MVRKSKEEKPKVYTRRQLSHFKRQKRRQRIIVITGIVVIAAVILIPIIGWFIGEYMPLRQTVLRINGVGFNAAYYLDFIRASRSNDPTSDVSTLSSSAYNFMVKSELLRQGAEELDVTVSDEEVKTFLEYYGIDLPATGGILDYYRYDMLVMRLKDDYFEPRVPETADQLHPLMMMLESEQQATEIRQELVSGGNFTALAGRFGVDSYSKSADQGDYGMHVQEILRDQVSTTIPLDYAFSAPEGVLSPPLSDNETYKQGGYWIINIVDRPEEGKVDAQALLISDNATAQDVRARLEAGIAELADMAEQYTQGEMSRENHGEFGVMNEFDSDMYPEAFSGYAFNPDSPVGQWSKPIYESEISTQGGAWLVQVLERQENAEISDEDRGILIANVFSDWFYQLMAEPDLNIESDLLTAKINQWVINQASKKYPVMQVQ